MSERPKMEKGKKIMLPPDPQFRLGEKNPMGHIHSICFPTNNESFTSRLLAANEAGTVYFWDLESHRLQHQQSMGESIQAIHSINDNIITQEKSGSIKLWTIQNNSNYQLAHQYACSGGFCRSVLVEDEEKLLVPQENSTVDLIDVNDMTQVNRFKPHIESLGFLMSLQKFNWKGVPLVMGGYESGDVIVWEYNSGEQRSHIKLRECITSLAFDPVTSRGICGNASNSLQIFTINRDFQIMLNCEICIVNDGCNVVKLRQDRKIFISGGFDGYLRFYSWKTLRHLVYINEHKGPVSDIQFSPKRVQYWDAFITAASSTDGTISLWDLYN